MNEKEGRNQYIISVKLSVGSSWIEERTVEIRTGTGRCGRGGLGKGISVFPSLESIHSSLTRLLIIPAVSVRLLVEFVYHILAKERRRGG